MVDFIDTPQKAAPSVLFLYDDSQAVFRAANIGDFGSSETGQFSGPTFSELPSPQKAAPAVMYLYDTTSGVFRSARSTDFNKYIDVSQTVNAGETIYLSTLEASGYLGAEYNFIVNSTGSKSRYTTIKAHWLTTGTDYFDTTVNIGGIGDTSPLSITGYKSGAYAVVQATSASDNWTVNGRVEYINS